MQYFDPVQLKGREWPPNKFRVTPELVEKMPLRVADLYGQMPNLVDSKSWGLGEITRRVAELYESHENGNFETEVLLAGNLPPLLLSYFASLDNWTELMGLVLLSGFCPCALVGLSLSDLLERNALGQQGKGKGIYAEWYAGRYTKEWDLPGHPTAEWILGKVSRNSDPWLLRLDGLTLSKNAITLEIYRQLLQQPHGEINTLSQKWTEYKDANIHGQLLRQLHGGINFLLPKWIEYKDANGWQVPNGKNVLRLRPSEFVRFAEEIKFDIPWLDFAEAHFPHLLPEESTGRPTPATEDRVLEGEDDLPDELQHKLDLLKRAYKQFWAKKDRNQRETYPKNSDVSEWLIEKGTKKDISSKFQADTLASFIRPEWAGTGRLPE